MVSNLAPALTVSPFSTATEVTVPPSVVPTAMYWDDDTVPEAATLLISVPRVTVVV